MIRGLPHGDSRIGGVKRIFMEVGVGVRVVCSDDGGAVDGRNLGGEVGGTLSSLSADPEAGGQLHSHRQGMTAGGRGGGHEEVQMVDKREPRRRGPGQRDKDKKLTRLSSILVLR